MHKKLILVGTVHRLFVFWQIALFSSRQFLLTKSSFLDFEQLLESRGGFFELSRRLVGLR
jgi:hypothetical protein